ncbi:hypothetical protein EOA33_10760 [Mesorhizobium sp. M4A.F.Ca.ET.050.02.1.1]|uniref:hypothetical protein n=1 Tax=Mesorhizobium sp. M4A.F.Ca.ET.050.02.1.1 TaxID=2496754 RepID=UPI000FCCA5BA|nr:hypothetical protein [Mesorhizobium sp. M4A.F.Ca.ET.050.02.1.1]RUX50044.1 hypothetical protein EOA33_10760 [Mesorhizobium sp. M4A.F.Ca.ET.050.02.1.1]TIT73197.1 MAG: hypothetical protein E5W60_02815 [Mesorhizobium sp.]
MTVFSRSTYKRLEEANVNDLVQFAEGDGSTLAIVTAKGADETFGFLILASTGDAYPEPEFTRFEPNEFCLNYGSEWVLEVLEDARSVPRSNDGGEQPGIIRLLPEGPMMIVRGAHPQDRKRLGLFNLDAGKFVGRERYEGAPCFGWILWATAADTQRAGARPIAKFPKEQTP